MTVLLHISDTHFGTERPRVVEALVRLARELTPRVLVLSGDITQRGRRSQFGAAKLFVNRLGVGSVLAIPGNHDIPLYNLAARLFNPYANHRREFGPELEPEIEIDDMLVLTLNTTRRWRHEDGAVSTAQIERVARRLEQARAGQLRVVVTHQPVAVTKPQDETNLLHGHEKAVRRWAAAGADLVLGGHIHLPFVAPLHKRFDDLARSVWAVQAGTAVSKRIRHEANNSVNVIRYGGVQRQRRCALVERWDYAETTQRFQLTTTDELHFFEMAHGGR